MHERDAERFVAHHAPQIVKFDLPPPLQLTTSGVRDAEALRAWFASPPAAGVIGTRLPADLPRLRELSLTDRALCTLVCGFLAHRDAHKQLNMIQRD